jgi:hypothetical protein
MYFSAGLADWIQSRSGSSILNQSGYGSGSTKSLNPDQMQFWINNKTLEDKYLSKLKKLKVKNTCLYFLVPLSYKNSKK